MDAYKNLQKTMKIKNNKIQMRINNYDRQKITKFRSKIQKESSKKQKEQRVEQQVMNKNQSKYQN